MCIEPPLPLAGPQYRPISSPRTFLTESPRVYWYVWSRYEVTIESLYDAAASMPIPTASCPSYRWQKPLMSLPL